MKKKPLVSIIINNFNYAGFLTECIDSALNQSYENIEIIVVDDGSHDGSREVILSYDNQIIPVFKDNAGQGSAYNAGFHRSKGEFICNLDADDTLFPEAVQKALLLFQDPQVVKVQWPLLITDKYGNTSGEMTTKWSPPEGDLKERILSEGPFYDFNLHTGCMVRRSLLEHIMPMPESWYKNGGDVYITTLAPLFGHLRNARKPLGTYRIHGNNHYAGRILDEERIKNYITRFEMNCVVLDIFSGKLGLKHDRNLWEKRNFNFLWPKRLLKAKENIENLVPAGESYVLVNGDEWGNGEPVKLRTAIPFPEQGGNYSGLPLDDESAIMELEKLRKKGASFLFFWWTSYWWFDHYKKFINYVENNYAHLSGTDCLISYDLRGSF